jgi:hypothetical protein
MTSPFVLISLVVFSLGVLALAVIQLSRRKHSARDLASLPDPRSIRRDYRPLTRLLHESDRHFLTSQPGFRRGMERRMESARRRILTLYLREIRRDFCRLWELCRLLAPMSRNPDFGSMIVRQYFTFHALYGLLILRCKLGVALPFHADPQELVRALEFLRRGSLRTVQSLDEQLDSAALSRL